MMKPNDRSRIAGSPPQRPDYSHAIETAYRDYLFRSRLEAKWAVFFDLCGWSWSYEPKDYNGWIPDFAIGATATLVEIKPFFHDEEWTDAIRKIVESGCRETVLLLGADPVWNLSKSVSGSEAPIVGELLEPYFDEANLAPRWNLNFGVTEGNRELGLCSMEGSWWNPIWSLSGKPARVWLDYKDCEKQLVSRWAKACNASRWVKHAK